MILVPPAVVTVRAAHDDDGLFVRHLFAATRADFAHLPGEDAAVQAVIDLQFAAQSRAQATRFPEAVHEIITLGAIDVGRLITHVGSHSIRVVDIAVLPEFQGQGIGSVALTALLDSADDTLCDVELSVWEFNTRAIALYARLGFRSVGTAGGYISMRRSPHQNQNQNEAAA